MERAALSAVIREDRGSFLDSTRANDFRSVILLSPGLTAECELLDCLSDKNDIFELCYSGPVYVVD